MISCSVPVSALLATSVMEAGAVCPQLDVPAKNAQPNTVYLYICPPFPTCHRRCASSCLVASYPRHLRAEAQLCINGLCRSAPSTRSILDLHTVHPTRGSRKNEQGRGRLPGCDTCQRTDRVSPRWRDLENSFGVAVKEFRPPIIGKRCRVQELNSLRGLLIREIDREHDVVLTDDRQAKREHRIPIHAACGDHEIRSEILAGRLRELRSPVEA